MKIQLRNRFSWLAVAMMLLALGAGCSSDSPSEPKQDPAPPPGTAPPSGNFSITVTANPALLPTGGDEPSVIRVQVRRADGQLPPNNSTVALSTTLGNFGSPGSGVQATALSLVNGTAEILLYPGDVEGAALIQARLENSIGQARVEIRGAATFFLSFVQPNVGSPQGGETVSIVGGGFSDPVRVTFNGVVAQVLSVTPDRIRAVTPPSSTSITPGNTLPVNVVVTVNLNEIDQESDTLPSGFVYALGGSINQPQVFSLSPASGVNEGGTQVRILGDGFVAPVQVVFGNGASAGSFNGVEATVLSVSNGEIVVRTPAATGFGQANQNQNVDVLIRNVTSGFSTVATQAFRYGTPVLITGVAPTDIPYDSRAEILINGQGFEAPVAVSLAGIAATVQSVTGSEIVVVAPVPIIEDCQTITGPVSVVNINSGSGDSTDDADGPGVTFIFRPQEPIITDLSPTSGPESGGNGVTISGLRFDEPVRVLFGDSAGSGTSVNADGTRIMTVAPAFTGTLNTEACDDDGDGTQGERFVPTSVDVRVINLVTDCEDTFAGAYTYTPADQSCRGDMGETPAMDPECNDGIDNDGDGFSDHASVNPVNPDPECTGPNDPDESS